MTFRNSPIVALALAALCLPATAAAQDVGDLVISEIVIAPTSGTREWFEVVNVSGGTLDLDGCVIHDGNAAGTDYTEWSENSHTIEGPLTVADDDRLVLVYGTNSDTAEICVAHTDAGMTNCYQVSDYRYRNGVGFSNTEAEHLAIVCDGTVVDEIEFDWSTFEDDCDVDKNCSVNLREELMDASSNDDWSSDSWCIPLTAPIYYDQQGAEARGTPGEANVCPVLLDPCGVADAMFTELMAAPPDGYKEWIEIFGLAGSECNLSGCEIKQGFSADPFDAAEDWDTVTIEGTAGNLPIVDGDFLLMAKSDDCIAGTGTGDDFVCDIPADLSYTGISLPNSDDKWLHLVCGDELVDSAPVMWSAFEAYCPQKGCAMGLEPEWWDATNNDLVDNWCVAGTDQALMNPSEETFYGSPGEETECLVINWPEPGEVIFTELIASPQGGISEYMELASIATEDREITFCELQKWRLDDQGDVDPDTLKSFLFGEDGSVFPITAGADQLLAYSSCLWEEADGGCTGGEYLYSTIQLSSDQEEHLALVCGDDVIDQVVFYSEAEGVRAGHSWMLDPSAYDAEANDNSANWCESAFSQQLDELSFPEDDKCNYGTPGEPNECRVDQADPPDPIMRCATGPGSVAWLSLLGLMGLVPLVRRRRR